MTPRPAPARLFLLAALAAACLAGCHSAPRETKKVDPPPVRDIPPILRGTIGAEATIAGVQPTLVSGLGIVVGLNGTGGGELPVQVQTTMERELARGGIGRGGPIANTDFGPVSPKEFLRSPNVAVVIVQASIPPGAPKGSRFDVFVRTLPGSSVTSLEGGMLWTTDLRFGEPSVFGAVKTRKIAEAHGPLFINPFSDNKAPNGQIQVTKTFARVLGGGVVTDPLEMDLTLDNESFARARAVVAAINSRFPRTAEDDEPTARGRGKGPAENASQSIAISVPHAWAERPADFIQMLRYTRIDQSQPQEWAREYCETLKKRPELADSICWLLQTAGKPALPFMAQMYDYPEFGPRMAVLEAGAKLGDARVVQPLAQLAKSGPPALRVRSIKLLSEMPSNPEINFILRDLLASPDLDARVNAYEGLRRRYDPSLVSVPVGGAPEQPKFTLDIVPGGSPMVYITQQGEPHILLMGAADVDSKPGKVSGLTLSRPLIVSALDDRLMMAAETPDTPPRLFYRDPRSGQAIQTKIPNDLAALIQFFARKPTPEDPAPGLDLTYSDVVSVLYELSRQNGMNATFATESDRLRAEIYEASQGTALVDRPESDMKKPGPADAIFKTLPPVPLPGDVEPKDGKITHVVPLTPKKKE